MPNCRSSWYLHGINFVETHRFLGRSVGCDVVMGHLEARLDWHQIEDQLWEGATTTMALRDSSSD